MAERDRLYEAVITEPVDFVFDDRVVNVFPDMINRSVPGYGTIVPMTGMLARRYAQPGSSLYDLGCSLGAVSLAMQGAVRTPGARIIAVDSSPDMIRRLEEILAASNRQDGSPRIETIKQDPASAFATICDYEKDDDLKPAQWPNREPEDDPEGIDPAALMKVLGDVLDEEDRHTMLFIDAGNCVGWGAHYLIAGEKVEYHGELSMAPLGCGVAGVIGA